MIEIIAFICIVAYVCTLPARVRRARDGRVPAKFKGDPARHLTNLRRETTIIAGCSVLWAVKNILDMVLAEADEIATDGMAVLLWAIIVGWLVCAAAAVVARQSLAAAPTPATE